MLYIFLVSKFLNKGKSVFWQKSLKICQIHLNTCIEGMFLIFWLVSYFEIIDQKSKIKINKEKNQITFWPKFQFFLAKMLKFSKIRNEKVRKHSLGKCISMVWQIFGDFCERIFLFKNVGAKKSIFGDFSKMQLLAKNLTIN